MKFGGVGQPVERVEDQRLTTGRGRYTDDINLPRQLRAYVLRSPHAHAQILSIDTADAAAAPGVAAVLTGADVLADGLGDPPCLATRIFPLKRPDGSDVFTPPRPLLTRERVRFVGDHVALVLAETLDQARDAAELIEVDYEELPQVTATAKAVADGAPLVWDECPGNVCFVYEVGDKPAVAAAFATADHVATLDIPVSRVAPSPMEPRAAVGDYDPAQDRYTLYTGTQRPHDNRHAITQSVLKIQENQLRVVSGDMGGGFGMRSTIYPELPLVLWAAKKLGRPVKWTADRSEAFLADDHGRDCLTTISLALDKAGNFLAARIENDGAVGAYLSFFGPFPVFGNIGGAAGVYTIPAMHALARGIFSNTQPLSPYRGAGRPEASLAIELIIDQAAREMGIDRIELRRRNTIPENAFPYTTALTFTYDCGEFEKNMDSAVALADYAGFEARRQKAKAAGKLRGLGVANVIEQAAGRNDEGAEIRFDQGGSVTVLVGTHSHGQGHETVFRQLISERLGLDFEQIRYVQGDTDLVPHGHGTFGSRSAALGGSAINIAADRIIEKGREIAAHGLEASVADIEFAGRSFKIAGTDRAMPIEEVARRAFLPQLLPPGMEPGLRAFASFNPAAPTFPNSAHISEVEIDPETGALQVVGYWVVDDVGTVLNPLLLKGQIHGGIAQGLGQVIGEQVLWDPDTGQLLTGSFMDYQMPRAGDMPPIEADTNAVPTAMNPLGVKGAGEAGCVGALPCLMSAVLDALALLGITRFDMPATPERVWRAIHGAVAERSDIAD
ncbi:MAG TPA: xanthine dehydrogenase family protein molybdopterin-binding subunit [Alphaproteobacteria bacterium]|nr:xanthine dehydrogenase family protein molybdopterin-binding subunit [Alphaproteobacteria bacterium]